MNRIAARPRRVQVLVRRASRMLLVLDAEASGFEDELTTMFLHHLMAASMASGTCTRSIGFQVALACGARLYLYNEIDPANKAWAAEVASWVDSRASHATQRNLDDPGVLALCRLPPVSFSRIVFITRIGSASCTEAALRRVLDALERQQHPTYTLELLAMNSGAEQRASILPAALIMLTGEYNFSARVLSDHLDLSAWVSEYIARRQTVHVYLNLAPREQNEESEFGDGATGTAAAEDAVVLVCCALPALLHDEPAADVAACICHGTPLHGRCIRPALRSASQPADPMTQSNPRPTCPVTNFELDSRDQTVVGCIGDYQWSGSIAAAAAAAAQTDVGARLGVDIDPAGIIISSATPAIGDGAPSATISLRAVQRIPLSHVSLSSLFGHPWFLTGTQLPAVSGTGDNASPSTASRLPRGVDQMSLSALVDCAAKSDTPDSSEGKKGVLCGLAQMLHAQGEALLLRCTYRKGFDDKSFLPANVQTLLVPNFVLVPGGPPGHALILKAVACPSQVVPLPCSSAELDETDDVEADKETQRAAARARAAALLSRLSLGDCCNPLSQGAGGTASLLAMCCAASICTSQRHQSGPPCSHRPLREGQLLGQQHRKSEPVAFSPQTGAQRTGLPQSSLTREPWASGPQRPFSTPQHPHAAMPPLAPFRDTSTVQGGTIASHPPTKPVAWAPHGHQVQASQAPATSHGVKPQVPHMQHTWSTMGTGDASQNLAHGHDVNQSQARGGGGGRENNHNAATVVKQRPGKRKMQRIRMVGSE